MISRRNFLKIAGLSTVAIGAGFTIGKLIGNKKSAHFAIHGFIPADERIINNLVVAFKNKIKSNSEPAVISNSKIGEVINRFDRLARKENFTNEGTITYRIKRLEKGIDSDIIISDSNNSVYSLNDFNSAFENARISIKNKKAEYFFTAEYNETDFLTSILNMNKKEVVIENEKGIVERIYLDKNYKNILIDGTQGKSRLKIENGTAQVQTSSCRHGICRHTVASVVGSIIACAPNKVLIKVV